MSLPSIPLAFPFRLATPDDTPALVDFIDYAGSGMPMLVWNELAGRNTDARPYGMSLVRTEDAPVSYRNAVVVDEGRGAIAGLISYRRPLDPQPISSTAPAITIPWQELNNLALGTWHIGAIAIYPEHRGQGWGTKLMGVADALRQASGADRTSLLVADANRARRLYERLGFREQGRRPMVMGDWQNPGKDWLLLIRG